MADAHANFAYSTVATAPAPAASGLSLVVAAGTGALFPAPPFNATIWPAGVQPLASNAEIIRVTALVTDTMTITRGQESSGARTVLVGDQIAATITKKTLTDAEVGGGSQPYTLIADSALNNGQASAVHNVACDGAHHDFACVTGSPPDWLDGSGNIILPGMYSVGADVICQTNPTTSGQLMQVRGAFINDWPVPLDAIRTGLYGSAVFTETFVFLATDLPFPTLVRFSMPTDVTGVVACTVLASRLASASA